MRVKEKKTRIRVSANIILLIGQFTILYVDVDVGILIKLVGSVLLIFTLYHYKMWDVILTVSAFTILELSKLFQ